MITELRHLQNAQFLTAGETVIDSPADLIMAPVNALFSLLFSTNILESLSQVEKIRELGFGFRC